MHLWKEQGLLTFMVRGSGSACMGRRSSMVAQKAVVAQAHARHGHAAVRLLLQANKGKQNPSEWTPSQLPAEALDGSDLAKARELLCAELPSLKVSRPTADFKCRKVTEAMLRHWQVWQDCSQLA